MAYNPFDFFRRNQKILFSVITVVIMFVFVLSVGGGQSDFFNWFPEWLRSKRSTGEVLAVIDGDKVKESKVSDLRRTRTLANEFLMASSRKAAQNLRASLAETTRKADPELRQVIDRAVNFENTAKMQAQTQIFQAQRFDLISQIDRFAVELYPQAIRGGQQQLASLLQRPGLKPDDRETVLAGQRFLSLAELILSRGTSYFDYFGDMPNEANRDALEFLLWLKKADSLGIRFRDEEVDELLKQEFLRYPDADREEMIKQATTEARQRNFGRSQLYEALAQEFRVQAAMRAVLGPVQLRGHEDNNAFARYDRFRTETSYASYGVVSVPVENFLGKVTGEPTPQERRKLFDQARMIERNPADPRLGLREPRKAKVSYFTVTGNEPFYVAAGQDAVKQAEAHIAASLLLWGGWGTGTAGLLTAPTFLSLPDPGVSQGYAKYKEQQRADLMARWYPTPSNFVNNNIPKEPVDAAMTTVLSAVSQIGLGGAGLAGTPAPVIGLRGAMIAEGEANENARRLAYSMPLLVPPLMDGVAALADAYGAGAIQRAALPDPLPMEVLKPSLAKQYNEKIRYSVCNSDLDKFEEEWQKLTVDKDKKLDKKKIEEQCRDLVAKFTGSQPWKDKDGIEQQGRNLTVVSTTERRDQYDLINDPAMAELAKSWNTPVPQGGYRGAAAFGATFFPDGGGVYRPIRYRDPTKPRAFDIAENTPAYYAWRTEEVGAEEPPKNQADYEGKVVALWKRQKARELARAAAEKLAKDFDGKLGDNFFQIDQNLTTARTKFAEAEFPADKRGAVRQFEYPEAVGRLPGVGAAMIVEDFSDRNSFQPRTTLAAFRIEPSQQNPYPNPKFSSDLVAIRNKPLSTAVVGSDQPENNFYVAVLRSRTEEVAGKFLGVAYRGEAAETGVGAELNRQFLRDAQKAERQLAVEMLKAEYGYEKEMAELDKKSSGGE